MSASEVIPYIALVISILSFITSFYLGFRDRVRVHATCKFYPEHPEYNRAHLVVRIVNRGRRVAVLTIFGGNLADGGWQGENLGAKERGLHLTEHEFFERKFYPEDIVAVAPDGESEFVELWFEDSVGKRHKVINSRKGIMQLKEAELKKVAAHPTKDLKPGEALVIENLWNGNPVVKKVDIPY